jgi:hypothetical protein
MLFIHQILKATPPAYGWSFRKAFRSTAFRLQGKTAKAPRPWITNFFFLFRMTLLAGSFPFRLRRNRDAVAIQYNDGNTREHRLYYFKKHGRLDCRDDQVISCHPEDWRTPIYYQELGWGRWMLLLRVGWMLWSSAMVACFKRTRVNPYWKIRFGQLLFQQMAFHQARRKQLLYLCYEPETYLSAFVAAALLPDYRPLVVSSNSVLFRDNRYLYHPRLDLKICSKFQEEETGIYAKLGWMEVGSIELWGLEEGIVFDRLRASAPAWDLGIYSSAGWARTHNLWRAGNIDFLRQGGFLDNPLYVQLKVILDTVCAFMRERPIRVKFYLHPHEIHLLKDHGIHPPYLDLLDANGIQYELNGNSTIENLYEARVGLAVSSTILFDRMNFGLRSYFYAGDAIRDNTIDIRFLGSYAKYGYHDAAHLRQILGMEFPAC